MRACIGVVARAPSSAASAAAASAAPSVVAGFEPFAQRGQRRSERVDHRLVARHGYDYGCQQPPRPNDYGLPGYPDQGGYEQGYSGLLGRSPG